MFASEEGVSKRGEEDEEGLPFEGVFIIESEDPVEDEDVEDVATGVFSGSSVSSVGVMVGTKEDVSGGSGSSVGVMVGVKDGVVSGVGSVASVGVTVGVKGGSSSSEDADAEGAPLSSFPGGEAERVVGISSGGEEEEDPPLSPSSLSPEEAGVEGDCVGEKEGEKGSDLVSQKVFIKIEK